MNKTIGIVVAVVVFTGGWWVLSRTNGDDDIQFTTTPTPTTEVAKSPSPSVTPTPTVSGISMAEVALHKDARSCYTVIRGEVYNLTLWIAQHPGGDQAILSICGKDGTVAFVNQHGGRSRQEDTLATFKIGALAK